MKMNTWRKILKLASMELGAVQHNEAGLAQSTYDRAPLLITGALQDVLLAKQSTAAFLNKTRAGGILVGPPPLFGQD
jgi:hypothetical protein